MKLNNIFTSFVIVDYLTNIDNESIINYALNLKTNGKSKSHSNKLGWQSANLDLSSPLFDTLFKEINSRVKEIHDEIGLKKNLENKLSAAWLNINKMGGYHVQHKHMDATLSGTYYLTGVESGAEGNIVWKNPTSIDYHMPPHSTVENFTNITSGCYSEKPEKGKLVIFPSWLEHYVEPNLTDKNRISIAFNTQILSINRNMN